MIDDIVTLRKGSRTIAELCGWTRDIVGVIHNAGK